MGYREEFWKLIDTYTFELANSVPFHLEPHDLEAVTSAFDLPPLSYEHQGMFGFFTVYHTSLLDLDPKQLKTRLKYTELFELRKKKPLVMPDFPLIYSGLLSTNIPWTNTSVTIGVGMIREDFNHVMTLCLSPFPEASLKYHFELTSALVGFDAEASYCANNCRALPQKLPLIQAVNHLHTLGYLGRGLYSVSP